MNCPYCNRNYKLQHYYEIHIMECKLYYENNEYIPNQKELFIMMKKMSLKINKLEKELDYYKNNSKRNIRKNILQVLREPQYNSNYTFIDWINTFQINVEHINIVLENGVLEGFKNCIEFNINNYQSEIIPICSFIQKTGYLYVFDKIISEDNGITIENKNQEHQWQVFDDNHMKFLIMTVWRNFYRLYMNLSTNSEIFISISEDIRDCNMKLINDMRRILYDKYRHEIKRWIYIKLSKELPVVTEIGF
jgi:hypothetical protein